MSSGRVSSLLALGFALTACGGGAGSSVVPARGPVGAPAPASTGPPVYTMTALPLIVARAISNEDVVVGFAEGGAAEYAHGSLTKFPHHADTQGSEAYDVNDNGEAVGYDTSGVQQGATCVVSAYLSIYHTDGTVTFVGPQPYPKAALLGINNNGVGAGLFGNAAISYPPLTTVFQPSAGAPFARGLAINDSGTIVGDYSTTPEDTDRKPFVVPALPNCCGTAAFGEASDINSFSHVVGDSYASDPNDTRAWIYANGVTTALATLPGTTTSAARAINDSDEAVGLDLAGSNARGVLWRNGQVYDLNALVTNLPPGAIIEDAEDINNSGKIVVFVVDAPSSAYVLTPQ